MERAAMQGVRAFSTSAKASTSKLSPLNKKLVLKASRASSPTARRGSDPNALSLAEAAAVLQAHSFHTPSAAYEINILARPTNTVQLNALRGRVFLPYSVANPRKKADYILVFAAGASAQAARDAGADKVGGEELIDDLLNGVLKPDKLLTTDDLLPLFTRNPVVGRFLGPKGLMPSVKRGTVSAGDEIAQAVREARGALDWKGDAEGCVRAAIGRLHFGEAKLLENVHTLLASISDVSQGGTGTVKGSPAKIKRPGLARVVLSSTQGPGIRITDV